MRADQLRVTPDERISARPAGRGHRRRRLPRRAVVERLRAGRRAPTSSCRASRTTTCARARASGALLDDGRPDVVIHLAAVVGGIGANRENPGAFFYDNLVMGAPPDRGGPARRRREVRLQSAPSAPTRSSRRCRSARTTSGTATPRRPTRPTAWPRRCCWSGPGLPRSSTASTASTCCRSTSTGPGDNFDPASSHVIPALIRKCVEAREAGADHIDVWGTGTATREFLYVDDAAEGIVLAAERYDEPEPVNLGPAARSPSATWWSSSPS